MKAMVAAWALSVSESAFARLWWKIGAVFDVVIPLLLFVFVIGAMGAVYFGFVQ